jgi:hypothetical protein
LGSELVRVRKPDDIRSECAVPPVVGDGTMTVPVLAGAAKEKPPPTATPRGEEGVAGKNEDDEDDDEEEEEEEEEEDGEGMEKGEGEEAGSAAEAASAAGTRRAGRKWLIISESNSRASLWVMSIISVSTQSEWCVRTGHNGRDRGAGYVLRKKSTSGSSAGMRESTSKTFAVCTNVSRSN